MKKLLTFALVLLACAGAVSAQQDFSDVEVAATPIRNGLYLLTGRGGNIVASAGEDGTFLVDDQYAPLTARIQAALDEVTDQPVRFVINTHWHGDHVGGNENFAEAGAVIVAHENVRRRMSSDQFMAAFNRTVPAAPAKALPVVTFADGVTLHLNGVDVRVTHVAGAHTDGDALVHFEQANVLHMGDIYFNGLYPSSISVPSAASTAWSPAWSGGWSLQTRRPSWCRAELAAYGDMLTGLRDRIAALKAEGKSLDEVVAARPTAEHAPYLRICDPASRMAPGYAARSDSVR